MASTSTTGRSHWGCLVVLSMTYPALSPLGTRGSCFRMISQSATPGKFIAFKHLFCAAQLYDSMCVSIVRGTARAPSTDLLER